MKGQDAPTATKNISELCNLDPLGTDQYQLVIVKLVKIINKTADRISRLIEDEIYPSLPARQLWLYVNI